MKLDPILAERTWNFFFYFLCGCILFFLVAPILVIIPLSFNSDRMFTFPLAGFSLQWYQEFFYSPAWRLAIQNTLIVACSVVLLSTSLGTLASLGLNMANFRFKGAVIGLLLSPMMIPHVIVGVGMFFFYSSLKLLNSLWGLILAHTACAVPFVVMTVTVTLSNFNLNYMRAASSLGARPLTTFFKVVLPLILPGVVSGGILAFVTSFDELIIAILLVGSDQRTLPRQMWSGIREEISMVITVAATVLILFSVLLMLTMELLRRRSEKMKTARI
jgi:putative spermidine/putrescine transport system permease protein